MNADPQTIPPADTPPAAPDAFAPAPDAPPPPPPPLAWPEWFRAFDIALAIFAVVLAFVLASFVARNPDLWRHLAAGRLISQFQYPVGGDPFTYTAADRPWLNANWLGEVLLHVLHSADSSGAVAVGVKAIAFAAALGLLFLLKKPGAPLWPWAVVAASAAVAAGAFTHLRPQVFALPVMAGLMAVLYTADWVKGNKWRLPAILGGLTVVWTNVDSFAFLSPLMIGLILAGDWLDSQVFRATPPPASSDDPFPSSPPRAGLWRALLLCAIGVLLNPTFVGGLTRNPVEAVAQLLPFELDFSTANELKEDNDLFRYTFSVLHLGDAPSEDGASEPGYLANPILGYNPSGVFTILLWAVGALAAGCSFARGPEHRLGRLSHLFVWVVLTALAAFVHARFVPYAMLVAVPFVSAHLNGFGRWVPPLDRLSEQLSRVVLIGCQVGRIVCLLGLVMLVVAAVPGWLHPWNGTAAGRRSVGWAIVPDEGLKRAGETFARWHNDPARAEVLGGVRGLNSHPDLGDYLAYYAPKEKSFVTSRYRLHREELHHVVYVRQRIYLDWEKYFQEYDAKLVEAIQSQKVTTDEEFEAVKKGVNERVKPPVEIGWLTRLADEHGIGYVSVAQAEVPTRLPTLYCVRAGFGVKPEELPLYNSPWHLDGRMMVIGRTRSFTPEEANRYRARSTMTAEEKAAVDQMEEQVRNRSRNRTMTWDVAREVFGPRTAPTPPPPLAVGVPPQQGWEYDLLLLQPPARPIGLDDADAYAGYIDQLLDRRTKIEQRVQAQWQQRSSDSLALWRQSLVTLAGLPALPLTMPQPNGNTFGPLPPALPQPVASPLSEQDLALPFLSSRAAREGLLVDPNSPSGYFSLAQAFSKPTMPATNAPAELFPVGPLPPLGPSDAELQVITALRRAISRLPEPGLESDEYTAEAIRTRVELTRMYLQAGWAGQVTGYRRVGKAQSGQIQVQPFSSGSVRVGYVDAARTMLNQLHLVVKTIAVPNMSVDEQRKAADKLVYAARGLLTLWQTTLQLCEADFWIEFRRYMSSGQVSPDWWDKIDRGEMVTLLVEADYLKKDDWTGWQEKFAADLNSGKLDPAAVEDRLKRLHEVLDRLVGRRMSRAPRPTERPAEAFVDYVQSGLFEKALQMVELKQGETKVDVRASTADALRLMLWIGRAEDVRAYLDKESGDLERADLAADARALERSKFRLLEFELAKLNGDYAKADTLFTEQLATPMGPRPPFLEAYRTGQQVPPPTMTDLIYPDLWRASDFPPLTEAELVALPRLLDLHLPPLSGELFATGGGAMLWANLDREQLRRRLLFQAFTHYQRGVYALLGGDPARAREQLDKAADPQGVKRYLTPLPPDATKEALEALPVQRLGPSQQLTFAFGQLLPKYRELLIKYDAK